MLTFDSIVSRFLNSTIEPEPPIHTVAKLLVQRSNTANRVILPHHASHALSNVCTLFNKTGKSLNSKFQVELQNSE